MQPELERDGQTRQRFSLTRCPESTDGNEHTGVGDLRGVPSIPANDTANDGAHRLGIIEGANQVGANVFLGVTAADGEDEDHVGFIQPGPAKP